MRNFAVSLTASLLASVANAAPGKGSGHGNKGTAPFLTPIGDQTWVIGNDVWNMTQGPKYGIKLYYKNRDCVGDAWGHYVSYSMFQPAVVSLLIEGAVCHQDNLLIQSSQTAQPTTSPGPQQA